MAIPTSSEPSFSEFYVHAVLQAARAHALGFDLDTSKSWGLNRAIFYEAAKKGYIAGRGGRKSGGSDRRGGYFRGTRGNQRSDRLYSVGRERAYGIPYIRGGVRFIIGGREQTPEAFDRNIKKRFPNWNLVWSEAMELMESSDKGILASAHHFHQDIYKRWRLEMRKNWPQGRAALPEAEKRRAA